MTTKAIITTANLDGVTLNIVGGKVIANDPNKVPVTDVGVANGIATLDSGGKIPLSELPASILGALQYQGSWNASTNTPPLASGTGVKGNFYIVGVAGGTNLDGANDWKVGDEVLFDGTKWDQIVGGSTAVRTVNGKTGDVSLATTDIVGFDTAVTSLANTTVANVSSSVIVLASSLSTALSTSNVLSSSLSSVVSSNTAVSTTVASVSSSLSSTASTATALSSALGTTNIAITSISDATTSSLSTTNSTIVALSSSLSSINSTAGNVGGIVTSLSTVTSTATALSTALSTEIRSTSSSVVSLSTGVSSSLSSGASTATVLSSSLSSTGSSVASLSDAVSSSLSTVASTAATGGTPTVTHAVDTANSKVTITVNGISTDMTGVTLTDAGGAVLGVLISA